MVVIMKSSVKRLLIVGLLAMLLSTLPACGLLPGTSTPTPSTPQTALTSGGAAAIILFNAVPALDHYLKQSGQPALEQPVNGIGEWDAVYEDNGVWRVKGTVLVQYPAGDKNCATDWTLNETDGTIKLVKFVCE